MKRKLFSVVVLAALVATPVYAKDLFTLTATVPGETQTVTFNAIEDIVDAVDNQSLQTILGSYTPTSAATLTLDVRGLPATVSYAAFSTTLVFQVPSLNISKSFTGATRDASQQLFEDYLESDGAGILKQILQELVATTAIDPVAGNPNSLMAVMGAADFDNGTDIGGGMQAKGQSGSSRNTFDMGLRYGYYSAGDYNQTVYSLPIKYTFRLDSDPRKQVIVDLPISYVDTEGGKSYAASLGLGYRFPINDDWSLTPAIRTGAAGSVDLGSAAIINSGSLTSNYNLYWDDVKVSIGNMAAQMQTSSISAGDYSIDYALTNTMVKNGIGFEGPVDYTIFGNPTSWQFDVANTLFFGDALYVDNYFDISASFGTRATESALDNLRVGLTITAGNNSYSGFRVNFGYTF
ncbi:MAG: hypothetical protein OEL66_02040 [Desulfobulbaceae bacterium]|nr:hypothetical protein [Desulfobulbaceae bacterium]